VNEAVQGEFQMAALTAADITTVISDRRIVGKRKVVRGTIAFGDGALTYPTAGVPLPALSVFGFIRSMDRFEVFGVNERTSDYSVKYGPANRTLLMYEEEAAAAGGPLLECDTSEAPAARTYSFVAEGW
jgi:hypothetical protein